MGVAVNYLCLAQYHFWTYLIISLSSSRVYSVVYDPYVPWYTVNLRNVWRMRMQWLPGSLLLGTRLSMYHESGRFLSAVVAQL